MVGHTLLISCLALNVYHESRGEDASGQLAVAMTTLNRFKKSDEGDMCKVVFAPSQFSWTEWGVQGTKLTSKGKPSEKEAWEAAKAVAIKATLATDITHGATHFHAVEAKPKWAKSMQLVAKIGKHLFYKEGTK